MSKPLHRLVRKSRRFWEIAVLCRRVNPLWHPNYMVALHRARRLCKKERFEPTEAFRLGLFRAAPGRNGSSSYVSRKRLTRTQEALNSVGWATLLKNKDLFYRHCTALSLPVPRLYAVVHTEAPGWSPGGRTLATRNDWTEFFQDNLPAEFAIKPAVGAYGHGFNIFRRTNGEYVDAHQNRLTADGLYDALVAVDCGRYVVQERLHNHASLVRLSGTEALQTVRMITLIDDAGDVHLLHAHLKVIEANEIVDTFLNGLKGNIEAPVTLSSGRLKPANRITGTGDRIATVAVHPKTGTAFEGFQLPFWVQACDLVKQTAPSFLPVRTVGWDVALTPEGPVIVEGNVWWDPPNQHGTMGTLLRQLEARDPAQTKTESSL